MARKLTEVGYKWKRPEMPTEEEKQEAFRKRAFERKGQKESIRDIEDLNEEERIALSYADLRVSYYEGHRWLEELDW